MIFFSAFQSSITYEWVFWKIQQIWNTQCTLCVFDTKKKTKKTKKKKKMEKEEEEGNDEEEEEEEGGGGEGCSGEKEEKSY